MSQVDRVHFLSILIWIIILFLIWYGFIIVWILPMYYKSFRTRVMLEKTLWMKYICDNILKLIIKKIQKKEVKVTKLMQKNKILMLLSIKIKYEFFKVIIYKLYILKNFTTFKLKRWEE